MQLDFIVGEVVSVDVFHRMSSGATVPLIKIRSFLDGSDVDVPWLPIGADQKMPKAGQEVLYYTFGGRNYRMVCFHGKNPDYIRKGKFGLNEGEVVVQADGGLGYLKLADDGSVELSSGDAVTDVLMSDEGLEANAPAFSFSTSGKASIKVGEDSTISLERRSKDDKILARLALTSSNDAEISVDGDVNIKGKNIRLDGNVFYGPGATDPDTAATFGDVITAGPNGTQPFDPMSGDPLKGSSTVKAAR